MILNYINAERCGGEKLDNTFAANALNSDEKHQHTDCRNENRWGGIGDKKPARRQIHSRQRMQLVEKSAVRVGDYIADNNCQNVFFA